MKTLRDYITEAEQQQTMPAVGDNFSFDLMEDQSIVSTYVMETTDDGIVLAGDERAFELLESYEFVLEAIQRYGAAASSPGQGYSVAEVKQDDIDLDEAEYQGRDVKLNKPMAGDVKKFKVYVKDPKTGNVKKVNFGQKGVKIKKNNPERRKSFRARHNCDNPGPKTKARYWSCRKW